MKTFLTMLSLVLLLATSALADVRQVVPFGLYSAASGSAVYSPAVSTIKFRHKTVQVNGYAMAAKTAAALSGTALVQCGPTPDGPWVTCAQEDSTAISTTANASLQWSDVSSYVRVSWAKTAGRVTVWLNLSE